MSPAVLAVLWALVAFQLKHFLCDFVLQTQRQAQTKGIYGHLGGIEHAGLHAVTSLPALLILTNAPALIAAVMVGEFVVHYHIDWSKVRVDASRGWTDNTSAYWIVFGLDQLLHQLTYLAITYLLLRFG
jgi:hypothetical protein